MAVCDFPKTSSKIGQTSTSCLQKFTIHFRRPDKLKQDQNVPYRGEYGFDWLRDEYIYPMETVGFNLFTSTPIEQKYTPLCRTEDIPDLKKEYLKDVEPLRKEFKLHDQDYYPAWLSIFACNVQGDNADAGSDIHKEGVYLDLQLDEIYEIIDDGTEIFFKSSDPCLKITPEKISISEFLKTKREKRILDKNIGQPEIYYYKLENAVKVICQGDTLKKHGQIKVFAKLGATEIEVGRLMVYKNNQIGKAKIVVVNVITDYDNNKKVIPRSYPILDYLFNYQSFNQAMIKVELKKNEDFDLYALRNENPDIEIFLDDMKNHNYRTNEKPSREIRNRLCALYEKYRKHDLEGKSINDKYQLSTYLFFTNLSPNDGDGVGFVGGVATIGTKEGGNMVVMFQQDLHKGNSIVHEVAHSFSLCHTFEPSPANKKPKFHRGYTDNFMDYHEFIKSSDPNDHGDNKHEMYSFFKWQWEMMRDDLSIEKKWNNL